jgi:putative ABC transport system permease protein
VRAVLTLHLSRTARHRHEAVIQRALGAGRGRIIRQFLAEAVIVGSAGAIIGQAISYASLELLKPIRGALARAFDLAKEGPLILGTEITLADGTKVPFGRIK